VGTARNRSNVAARWGDRAGDAGTGGWIELSAAGGSMGPNGVHSGTISGGCLEAEVVRKAAWMVREGAMVERYSRMFDDTAQVLFGLGCGGIVDLLLEPTDTLNAPH
jgi:hypothetical protein